MHSYEKPSTPMTSPDETQKPAVFLSVRLAGGRFDTHTLPLDVLPDIASYRRLVVEVAKHLFKESRGDRVRVPKGFEQSFHLAISSMRGGNSASIELVEPEFASDNKQNQLFTKYPEFDQAREFIANLIRIVSQGGKVPDALPPHLVGLFNPFGQSLRDDEFVELNSPVSGVVRYSEAVRRSIVLSSEHIIESGVEAEFILNGGVVDTGTIHVRSVDGRSLDFQPASQFEFDEAYKRAKGKVKLVGTGLYDESGGLRRLLSVNAQFDRPAFHLEVRTAVDEAKRSLEYQDEGQRSQVQANLQTLQEHIEANTDPNLEIGRPYVYVLEDSELSIEWTKEDWEANIEMSPNGAEYKLHALNTASQQTLWSKVQVADREKVREAFALFFSALAVDPREE